MFDSCAFQMIQTAGRVIFLVEGTVRNPERWARNPFIDPTGISGNAPFSDSGICTQFGGSEAPRRLKPAPYMKAPFTVKRFFLNLTPPLGGASLSLNTLLVT
jgi:hypothetical protein